MVNVKRIVCPIDFSEPSQYAVQHAVEAARWWNASITLIHVHSLVVPWGPVPGVHGDVPVLPAPEPSELAQHAQRCYPSLGADVAAQIVLKQGSPAREIIRLAEDVAADLLVMGTHGHGGFDRMVLGSVTEKVLRRTNTPVLTVSPQTRRTAAQPVQYRTILCPQDFSAASSRALQYALTIAAHSDAKIILLHVVEGASNLPRETAHFNVPEYGLYLVQDAKAQLQAVVPASARGTFRVEEQVTTGKAYREILRVAAETDADLIVMGVHGRGIAERWFGSTTSHVTREADSPVLTVRGESEAAGVSVPQHDNGRAS